MRQLLGQFDQLDKSLDNSDMLHFLREIILTLKPILKDLKTAFIIAKLKK